MFIRQMYIIDFINNALFRRRNTAALSALLLLAMISTVNAATMDVTAEFIADLSQPQKSAFVNTTPISGFCAEYPSFCHADELSIFIPGLEHHKDFDSASLELRNNLSISINGREKHIVLKDMRTSNTIDAVFRITFFGLKYSRLNEADGSLGDALYAAVYEPQGGCSGRNGTGGPHVYNFGWGVPDNKVVCYFMLKAPFKGTVNASNFSIGYKLDIADNPLNTYSGDYESEVIYSVGDGQDIDFYSEIPPDSEIRIKIKATVRHAFKFFLAPGSENVSLAPKGGWSQWVNGGRVPDLLNKEVPFTLSSTSGFTVNMRCEYDVDEGCALRDSPTGEKIPLEVALTLPGFKAENGSEVRNLLLNSLPAGHVIQPPGKFVVDRRSQVDFRVRKPGVETMVKSPGSTWRGTVTLVFDTQTD
ncbi:hypothetical protein F3J28_07385 [Enterobacter sp. Ap-1006]|uniref:hypothetical protein n=1 Tax=Enterobacter sp. Ap-1006 TaxID=2608345 RepID=UPI001420993A|nr:hypothetical protein [Enterobacter sp. Ap-1006]NIF47587.1 hypothetical protein [Enterobacter sp. Ap-1006]